MFVWPRQLGAMSDDRQSDDSKSHSLPNTSTVISDLDYKLGHEFEPQCSHIL